MITALSSTAVWVVDQDEVLDFCTGKLGVGVRPDARMDDFRWLTVSPPVQPGFGAADCRGGYGGCVESGLIPLVARLSCGRT